MRTLAFALALVMASGTASAQDRVSSGDPQSVADTLSEMEYFATVEPYSNGRPRVRVRIGDRRASIAFYGCKDDMNGCRSLLFSTGFRSDEPIPLSVINEWNERQIFSRAYLDDVGDPFIEMPVVAAEDLSDGEFERIVNLWKNILDDFVEKLTSDDNG